MCWGWPISIFHSRVAWYLKVLTVTWNPRSHQCRNLILDNSVPNFVSWHCVKTFLNALCCNFRNCLFTLYVFGLILRHRQWKIIGKPSWDVTCQLVPWCVLCCPMTPWTKGIDWSLAQQYTVSLFCCGDLGLMEQEIAKEN